MTSQANDRNESFDARRRFEGRNLLQIAMPMGGIGAGSISLNGYGGVQDLAIHHRPSLTAWPDDHQSWASGGFAVLHVEATSTAPRMTRLVEGPLPPEKIYDQGLQAQGHRRPGSAGLPRFDSAAFEAGFPVGVVSLSDRVLPISVKLTGWSPMIPLDDHHSSMPCAVLEYELTNTSNEPVSYAFSYHLNHLVAGKESGKNSRNHVIPGRGVLMNNVEPGSAPDFGGCSLTCFGHSPLVKGMWLRGGWFDWLSALWRELTDNAFEPNEGNADRPITGVNGGSIQLSGTLAPCDQVTYPIIITWHVPNVDQRWEPLKKKAEAACCDGDGCCGEDASAEVWRPYYAAHWEDAAAVADTMHERFDELRRRTFAFKDALFNSTLPGEAIDAIASNLAIIKSPTLLRQANGNLWAWEGCFGDVGCCPGSCTHVWNYAQAIPHLFPALERTFREQELERSMDEQGHVGFRAALPDGPVAHDHHPAADGQLGGIMKTYREWVISGDDDWLRKMYPLARRSLDYCIARWDPDRLGAVIEPHHNTYDIEFWGPDGMCTTVYVGALAALGRMADHLGEKRAAAEYLELARRGAAYLDHELFNGEYYQQHVRWKDLRDDAHRDRMKTADQERFDPARTKVLADEGPAYQYGAGCLSDGVIGAWMADLYGLEHPINPEHVGHTLDAIFKHNFKEDLSDHACTQRPGYALGHEAGLILCTWPRGGRPTLPFVYSDEVWTGIEYQVASHLILRGRVEEGLSIVRGVRSRHDGLTRNPFNEYECGSFYARALASYALLQSLSGFAYNATNQTLEFGPRIKARPWRSFFCAASGYGVISLDDHRLVVEMIDGELIVQQLVFADEGGRQQHRVGETAMVSRQLRIDLTAGP